MSNISKPKLNPWVSRAMQALPVMALLVFIGFRVYGYFASSETDIRSAKASLSSGDIRAWRSTGNDAYANKQWDVSAAAYEKITKQNRTTCEPGLYSPIRCTPGAGTTGPWPPTCTVGQFAGRPRQWALANIAAVYALKGEKRMALDYLQEAVAAGFRQRLDDPPIAEDPDFQSIADDPEFQRLVELTKPVSQRSVYRQFDFVIGKWTLQTLNDRLAGSLEFSASSRGYALVGNGVDEARSLRFTVMGYYDPQTRAWKQVWMDDQGTALHLAEMSADDQTISLEGTMSTADGRQQLARVIYEEVEGGLVRLTLENSPDAGNRWDDMLDVMMVPTGSKKPGGEGPKGKSTT